MHFSKVCTILEIVLHSVNSYIVQSIDCTWVLYLPTCLSMSWRSCWKCETYSGVTYTSLYSLLHRDGQCILYIRVWGRRLVVGMTHLMIPSRTAADLSWADPKNTAAIPFTLRRTGICVHTYTHVNPKCHIYNTYVVHSRLMNIHDPDVPEGCNLVLHERD